MMDDPYIMIDLLAAKVMDEHRKTRPDLFALYDGDPNHPWAEDTRKQLTFLFDAATLDSPQLFIGYIAWSKVIIKHAGMPPDILFEKLQIMRDQCHMVLQFPFSARVDQILEETIRRYPTMPESNASFIDANDSVGRIANEYLEDLLQGRKKEAEACVRNAFYGGMDLTDLYLGVFQKAQYELGRRWQEGLISVAQEHYVTEITLQLMAQLYAELKPLKEHRANLVVTSVGNEMHEIGARMLADLLEADGWSVSFLGPNTPHPDIISISKQRQAKMILVSVTMAYNVRRARALIKYIRGDPELRGVKILVGGRPFNEVPDLWKTVGADGWAKDASEAVRLVNEMVI
jgi:methanogenic corrinoid protein MtbC1